MERMSRDRIQVAQDYLTMISENRVKRIVDVEHLLARHPKESVLSFLDDLYYNFTPSGTETILVLNLR